MKFVPNMTLIMHYLKNINDKHNADKRMINSINNLPYRDKQWGTFLVKNIINTKQK